MEIEFNEKLAFLFEPANERGVYAIVNLENDKLYVGSAINFKLRWRSHINLLNNDKHQNIHLQRAWNKHGQLNFIFVILELISDKFNIVEREQHWIDFLKPTYNILPKAGSRVGMVHSAETRVKIGLAGKNRIVKEETRAKLAAAGKGRKHSPETIEKLKLAAKKRGNGRTGLKHSEETKKKMSEAQRKRHSENNQWR